MLSDFQAIVDDLVRDESAEITADSRERAIALAVTRYSTDRPRAAIEEVTAVAGEMQDLPPGWDAQFSAIAEVKRTGGDKIPAAVELTLGGEKIRLGWSVTAGEELQILYTQLHVVSEVEDTVPFKDREAVCCWAASLLLEQLASLYAGHQQSTLDADAVNFGTKAGDYARRAQRMRQTYLDHLGIDPKRNVAAGVVVDLDQAASDGKRRLFKTGVLR
ncbi:MAG: hypothetical protein RIB45_17850 [Marivibrio sp.]|uniref:hypothetical protein n=1 Tax=Marivibrio sp. TaxID=2039719 RepID=UPI0032EE9D6F